jgi:hypothetical protein
MISALFFYQLALIALLWLCCMLPWVWLRDRPMVPSRPPTLRHHDVSAAASRNLSRASPASRPATPVRTPVVFARKPPQLHRRASYPSGDAAAWPSPWRSLAAAAVCGLSSLFSRNPRPALPWQTHLC